MNKTMMAIACASVIIISACSSSHSPKTQDNIDRASGAFDGGYDEQVKKYRPVRSDIGLIHYGPAYHNINDYALVQHDSRKLPSAYGEPVLIKELDGNGTYSVDEFSALVYESFGVFLDVSAPDLKSLGSSGSGGSSSSQDQDLFLSQNRDIDVSTVASVGSDSAGDYDVIKNLLDDTTSGAGNNRDGLRLKKFRYNGTLKGLLDYVTQLNGLKWKYDADNDRAFMYAYDTKIYTVHDFGDDIDSSGSITTDTAQDSGSTSGGSSKSFSRKNQTSTWSDIEKAIGSLTSKDTGTITFNQKAGLVSVTDSDYNQAQIKRYIDELNSITTANITVEFKMIRFSYDDIDRKGINQNYLNDKLTSNILGSFDLNVGAGSVSPVGGIQALQDVMKGNVVSVASDSHKFLMGFLNTVGTAEVAYQTQVEIMNNDTFNDQLQKTEEYISAISRSNITGGSEGGPESLSTERDVGVDGTSLTLKPRIIGDKIMVSYSLSASDFLGLKDAGVGGVQLKTQDGLNLDHTATLINGIPKVVKFTHQSSELVTTEGMFDDLLWFLGGKEYRDENKAAIIVIMTAYYNH
jgi:hypothetical protein